MEDGKERRRAKWPYGLRSYKLSLFAYSKTAMDIIWDFFVARKGSYDVFLVKIPTEYQVVAEAIGTGDGVKTDFVLDEFPVDTTGNFTIYVAGSPVAATLSNNFTGEFSYATIVAPTAGQVVTGSYEFYFQVKFLADTISRQLIAYQLLNMGIELKEVRWDVYRPRAGNSNLIKGSTYNTVSVSSVKTVILISKPYIINMITIAESISTWTNKLHAPKSDSVSITEGITVAIP
jgi:uncharacterized protein (TIGR02217 family)